LVSLEAHDECNEMVSDISTSDEKFNEIKTKTFFREIHGPE